MLFRRPELKPSGDVRTALVFARHCYSRGKNKTQIVQVHCARVSGIRVHWYSRVIGTQDESLRVGLAASLRRMRERSKAEPEKLSQ